MTDRTEFESQCDAVAETLDKLSDWEKMFYLYCLLPWFTDKIRTRTKEMKTETMYDALHVDAARHTIKTLEVVREALAEVLF